MTVIARHPLNFTSFMKYILPLLFSLLICSRSEAQITSASGEVLPPYLSVHARWVDSILNSMTLDEKIGQLFMIACWSRNPDSEKVRIGKIIEENHIGGLIFMQGGPLRQAALTNYFQVLSKVPLLISQDAEWGLSMRLDSTMNFSKQLMLGAIRDTAVIHDFGAEMARELKRLGVHISFSPVVDINNNPLNPVIGDRSFGENKYDVTNYGLAYMHGLQSNGIIACAKHFPGHGNTDEDSHKVLPVINASRSELDSTELYPFRKLMEAGVGSIMVAHLNIPALDTTQKLPSSLSPQIVTGLLRNELGFHGLVITDALNMRGAADYMKPGIIDVSALLAGNDILLFSTDVPLAVQMIRDAITAGKITETEINIRVRKILQAKYWCGLSRFKPIELNHLYEDLNSPAANYIKQQIIEQALVLPRNKNQFIPIQRPDTFRFAALSIGDTSVNEFQDMLSNYAGVKHFSIAKNAPAKKFADLLDSLKNFNAVFVSLHAMSRMASINYGITDRSRDFVNTLQKQKKVLLTLFGSPYALQYFGNFDYVLVAFNEDPVTQEFAAQAWFGGIGIEGKLPVTASLEYYRGRGFITTPIRMKFSVPEDAGLCTDSLARIDDIVYEAMSHQAIPGCQVLVAKDGKVIWDKCYGNFTYDALHKVEANDMYDIASVTKIAATTLMVMKLYEEKKIDLDKCVEDYLPELKNTNKSKLKIYELLTHEGGLKPYIPFYRETMDSTGNLNPAIYQSENKEPFTVEVTPSIFMNKNYVDTLWARIITSPVTAKGKYVYSDLDFYFLKRIAEKVSGQSLDQYMEHHFYEPLGLSSICFNPLRFFPSEHLAPSNFDYAWRKQLIQGTVHDQGAAMLGGVAGHAGLFSNATDLAILMQMLANGGTYAGRQYLDTSTVRKFTSQYSMHSRRGLGFDKPELQADRPSPTCSSASPETFGHQGFTGTCVWVDPAYHLVYVFLSNRTFPDDNNEKLTKLSTRTRIQEAIYDAIRNAPVN